MNRHLFGDDVVRRLLDLSVEPPKKIYSACSPEEFCEYLFRVFAYEFCIENGGDELKLHHNYITSEPIFGQGIRRSTFQ